MCSLATFFRCGCRAGDWAYKCLADACGFQLRSKSCSFGTLCMCEPLLFGTCPTFRTLDCGLPGPNWQECVLFLGSFGPTRTCCNVEHSKVGFFFHHLGIGSCGTPTLDPCNRGISRVQLGTNAAPVMVFSNCRFHCTSGCKMWVWCRTGRNLRTTSNVVSILLLWCTSQACLLTHVVSVDASPLCEL